MVLLLGIVNIGKETLCFACCYVFFDGYEYESVIGYFFCFEVELWNSIVSHYLSISTIYHFSFCEYLLAANTCFGVITLG